MRKVGRAFGFTKEASKKNVAKDVGKNVVEFWSLGELDAVSVKVYAGEAPTTCLVEVMPPQSTDRGLDPALGAYCLLIDVSYSMSHEAQVTTDEGEKTGFGYSLLDIAKHATSTFISTMSDGDYVTIVTYSSSVRTVQEWIKCDAAGKATALAVVARMRPEVETNLAKGLTAAFEQMTKLPIKPNAIHQYNLQMIHLTDGRPTPEYHPGEGVAWREQLRAYRKQVVIRPEEKGGELRLVPLLRVDGGEAGELAQFARRHVGAPVDARVRDSAVALAFAVARRLKVAVERARRAAQRVGVV